MSVQESAPAAPSGPSGIGGWLGLLAVGMVFGPLRLLSQAAQAQQALADVPADEPIRGFIFFEVVVFGVLGVALIAGAVLFFQKKRAAPAVIGTILALGVLFTIFETVVIALYFPWIPAIDPATIAAIIIPLLWIAYLRASERVRNTFVN
jgi:hypothetical protein